MSKLLPAQRLPDFNVLLTDGGQFQLSQRLGENMTLLLFYRGLHCSICKGQLLDLQRRLDDLAERGVTAVAISMDSQERAEKSSEDWHIDKLLLGYGLSEETARELGLFLSAGRPESSEPEIFSEPGLFLVKPDQSLYFASIQNMPFARPPFDQLIQGIDFVMFFEIMY